jgi:hypothetical protein
MASLEMKMIQVRDDSIQVDADGPEMLVEAARWLKRGNFTNDFLHHIAARLVGGAAILHSDCETFVTLLPTIAWLCIYRAREYPIQIVRWASAHGEGRAVGTATVR